MSPKASRSRPNQNTVAGKRLLLVLLGCTLFTVALVVYFGLTGGSTHVPRSQSGIGFSAVPLPSATPHVGDGGASRSGHER